MNALVNFIDAVEERVPIVIGGRRHALVILLAGCIALAHGGYGLASGPLFSPDAARYVEWAETLIAVGFNPFSLLQRVDFVTSPVQYLAIVYLIALAMLLFGPLWPVAFVVLNGLFCGLGAFFALDLVRRKIEGVLPLLLVATLFLISFDIVIWAKFILTDLLFLITVSAVLWNASRLLQGAEAGQVRREFFVPRACWVVFLLLLAFLTRPTALPLLGFLLPCLLAAPAVARVASENWRRFLGYATLVGLVLGGALMVLTAWLLIASAGWSGSGGAVETIKYYASYFAQGAVVHDRPETYLVVDPTVLDYLRVMAYRLAYFYSPVIPGYGLLHLADNLLVFVPSYVLAVVTLVEIFRPHPVLDLETRWMVLLCWGTILAFALFTALTLLDYDHRYRLPALPALFILSGIGIGILLRRGRCCPSDSRHAG
ncbi:MAG: hypothetical protein AB1413_02915 [Thermodesulfobacteriota bacterium]